MSTKSAKPVQTKEEALFDKVKNAISDVWGSTIEAAEDFKEKAEEKINELKGNDTEKKPAVKQEAAPANQTEATRSKAAINSAKPKAKVAFQNSTLPKHAKTEGAELKKATAKKTVVTSTTTKKKVNSNK